MVGDSCGNVARVARFCSSPGREAERGHRDSSRFLYIDFEEGVGGVLAVVIVSSIAHEVRWSRYQNYREGMVVKGFKNRGGGDSNFGGREKRERKEWNNCLLKNGGISYQKTQPSSFFCQKGVSC